MWQHLGLKVTDMGKKKRDWDILSYPQINKQLSLSDLVCLRSHMYH